MNDLSNRKSGHIFRFSDLIRELSDFCKYDSKIICPLEVRIEITPTPFITSKLFEIDKSNILREFDKDKNFGLGWNTYRWAEKHRVSLWNYEKSSQ